MRLRVMKTRTMPIGIDLGSAAAKMVQLRRVEQQLELAAAARIEIPPDRRNGMQARLSFLDGPLRELLKTQDFKGHRCILALPAEAVFIEHIRTPKLPSDQLEQALRQELKGKLPFDPADAVIRSVVAGEIYSEGQAGQEVIVIAASQEVVDAHLEFARRSRLTVTALNVEPCAIVECFARLFRRSEDSRLASLFLDMGEANTQAVIAHGAKLAFARNITFGARHMDEAASARLGVSVEEMAAVREKLADDGEQSAQAEHVYEAMREALEKMVDEVTKCLRYYDSVFPSQPVERAIFLGGQALDRRLCQWIAQRINLPSQIGDPLARIVRPPGVGQTVGLDRRQAQPAWAVAVGLSLGADLPEAA